MTSWPTNPGSRTQSVHYGARKLGDIAEVIMGQSPPSSSYNERGEGLPFFQGKAEFGEIYPTPVKYCSSPSRIAEANDILISVRAPVGNINIAKEKSCVGRGLGALRAKKNILNQMFLFYFMKKNENNWSRLSTGSTFSAIKGSSLKNFEIPLPPIATQKQIVKRLDKIAEAQKLNDDLIQKSDELFQSLLYFLIRANSGIVKKLGEISEIIMGQSPPSSTYNERGEGLPFFQGKAEFGEIYPTPVKYCPKPTRIAEAGDILMSVRAPVGNINLVKERSGIGRGLGAIRARKGVDQSFLYFFFIKNENSWSRLSVGSTFSAIRRNNLDNLEVPLPPLATQKQIVAKLSAVQEYKTQLIAQRTKLKELFDSALHKSMKNE